MQQQCHGISGTGVSGPGSIEHYMGGEHVQGQYCVSVPNVSWFDVIAGKRGQFVEHVLMACVTASLA